MKITGRLLKKNHVARCPTCRGTGHLVTVGIDYDAYWILDYEGNEDPKEGSFAYDRVAFPTLREAQARHQADREMVRLRHDNDSVSRYLRRKQREREKDQP